MTKKLIFNTLAVLFLISAVNVYFAQDIVWFRTDKTEVKELIQVGQTLALEVEVKEPIVEIFDTQGQLIALGTYSQVMSTLEVIKKNPAQNLILVTTSPKNVVTKQIIRTKRF